MATYEIDKIKLPNGDIVTLAGGDGTVTSVGVSNATNGGLSVSGSPVTGSGTITVGHSNVLTSAQTTQAVYPIKIDKNGHISAYGAAATASDVGALPASTVIPSKTSQLTNDSGFLTSYTETDPVFTASPAHGITSADITSWNNMVSDDKTWNGVSLSKSSGYTTGDGYVPFATSTSPSSMSFTKYTATPAANEIAKYNSSAYLISTTPSANDNSTKVATTAYVDAAIPTVLDPLIGDTTTITPAQVKTALGEGRDICVSTSGTLAEVPLTLKFTSWNSATDTDHSGQAIDVVVSQTIARYGFQYYLFELVGLVSSGEWHVYDPVLVVHGDDISAFNNDVGYITSYTETDPTVPSWAKAPTKPSYTASEVGALANTGGEVTGDIILKSAAATNSPSVIFQRGTLTDNYNDWRIQDRGGYLYFEQRGSGSTDWSQEAMINTNGTITATTFSGNIAWSNVTGKPTFATVATSGSYNDLVDLPTIPTVPSAGTTATAVSTTSSGGSATTWSKSDHVHSISSSTITSALGYTPYDSTNPNGYTTNKGTVTSVTASGALSSSGGTTPAITHNAPSTSPAKSTQAVYPITIDSYGHITSAGSAVDIPSTNLIILDVSPNLSGEGYTVSFNSDSMSYTDACTAINNGEIVYIKLNGSLGVGTYFEEADLARIFGPDGAIDRITATFVTSNVAGTGSSALSCNIVSDSSATLTDIAVGGGGVTNITAIYNFDTDTWTYPSQTPASVITAFSSGPVIITFTFTDGESETYSVTGEMLDYGYSSGTTAGVVTFSTISLDNGNGDGSTANTLLKLSFSSGSWSSATMFELIDGPSIADQLNQVYKPRFSSTGSTPFNLNTWINPGSYPVNTSAYTYNFLPGLNLSNTTWTTGLVEVLVSGTSIIQRFRSLDGSYNINAMRYSSDGGTTWGDWYYDNVMSSYTSWGTGTHDANSPIIGTVWCRAGSSYVSNLPSSATYGFLITTGRYTTTGTQMLHQTFTEYSNSGATGFYIRYYANNQWYPWVLIGPASYTDANNNSY